MGLHSEALLLVRVVVEDEGDGALPGALEDDVSYALLVSAVVPLRQVVHAVTVGWRHVHLDLKVLY